MGMLFMSADTKDILEKLNRNFAKNKLSKMRKPERRKKFGTDPKDGRTLARCAKTFKLHPRKDNYLRPALRWFWLLRNWATVTQVDPDTGSQIQMADVIKKWIYEGLTSTTASGSFAYDAIIFDTSEFNGPPSAGVKRDSKAKTITITAYTSEVEAGVEDRAGYDIPPGPDPNEDPPDAEDPVDDGTATKKKKKAVKKKKS